jgi:deazaflavin-dependent oxidoreductase (nitroreductase family)
MVPLGRRAATHALGGCLLVLHCRGRRTGHVRRVPLNYAPAGPGALWIIAGFGQKTGWLHNVSADPAVQVTLGRRLQRFASEAPASACSEVICCTGCTVERTANGFSV